MKKVSIFLLVLVLSGCTPAGLGKKTSFDYPDIKDDFCGIHINYQFCKCAFHNQFCKEIGLTKKQANAKVRSEYDAWIAGQLETFRNNCTSTGGIVDDDECQYCKEGYSAQNGECKEGELTTNSLAVDDALFNPDCSLKEARYDADWKKYSDIDEAIPFEDRSYEAKQALTVYESMVSKMLEGFALERDVEIEKQMQAELQAYRDALTQNLKTNLLKSFWRLAWVTYSTIDSTKGLKGSYEKLLDLESVAEGVSAGLKIVRSGVPSDSSLAIDTSSISGKVKSSGASIALDAVESLGDPATIATTLFQEAANATLPSADITDEEVAILRTQHEQKGLIEQILKESAAANAAREAQMQQLELEIAELQAQIDEWEGKEKERVRFELEKSCKKTK